MFAQFFPESQGLSSHPELNSWRVPLQTLLFRRYLGDRTALFWLAHTQMPRTVGTIVPANEIHMYPIMNNKYWNKNSDRTKKPENMRHAVVIPRTGGTWTVSEFYYGTILTGASLYLVEPMPADLSLDVGSKMVSDKCVLMTDFIPVGGSFWERRREASERAKAAKLQLEKDFPEFFPEKAVLKPNEPKPNEPKPNEPKPDKAKAKRGDHDTESDSDHEQAQAPCKLQRV
jgi:hypothetical protein